MMRNYYTHTSGSRARHAAPPLAALLGCVLSACAHGDAHAQTSLAQGVPTTMASPSSTVDRELADYLALLQRIAPASETGARTYVAAIRLRCGLALDAAGLRRAMAVEGGDPALMGLIRAAATQDRMARHQAVAQLRCPHEERR